ncbi:hypothetical protein SALBM135S_10138 [Streptomyces alboniger]
MTTVVFPMPEAIGRRSTVPDAPEGVVSADTAVVVPVGTLFDVVIFPAGRRGLAVIHWLDDAQRPGCGPMLATLGEAGQPDRYFALVPSGTAMDWTSPDARCFDCGTIRLPERSRLAPPGRYWMRPFTGQAQGRLVCPALLRQALDRYRPYPVDRDPARHLSDG